MMYLKTEIESTSREASHRSHHVSGDYASLLKIGEYVQTETSEDTTACGHCNNSPAYEIVTSFYLPLQYLSMPNVDAASNCRRCKSNCSFISKQNLPKIIFLILSLFLCFSIMLFVILFIYFLFYCYLNYFCF